MWLLSDSSERELHVGSVTILDALSHAKLSRLQHGRQLVRECGMKLAKSSAAQFKLRAACV
jgi:hypothetical protein